MLWSMENTFTRAQISTNRGSYAEKFCCFRGSHGRVRQTFTRYLVFRRRSSCEAELPRIHQKDITADMTKNQHHGMRATYCQNMLTASRTRDGPSPAPMRTHLALERLQKLHNGLRSTVAHMPMPQPGTSECTHRLTCEKYQTHSNTEYT